MVRNRSRAAGQGGDRPGHGALGTLLGAWNPVQGRRQVRGSSLQSHGRFTETEHEKESEQSPGYDSVKNVHTAETPTALTGLSEASLCPQTCGKLFRSLRTRSLHVEQNHSQSHRSQSARKPKMPQHKAYEARRCLPSPALQPPGQRQPGPGDGVLRRRLRGLRPRARSVPSATALPRTGCTAFPHVRLETAK